MKHNFHRYQFNSYQLGFTLIELMITVAIVGILAAIALPSYSGYVNRSNRASGKSALLETAQYLERVRSTNFAYPSSTPTTNPSVLPARLQVAPSSGRTLYVLTLDSNGSSFTLTATPSGWTDTACGALTLTNLGVKGQASGTVDSCWNK